MEYDPVEFLARINAETQARLERERIQTEKRNGHYQSLEQWNALFDAFKTATRIYCENRSLIDSEENQRQFAAAILKTAKGIDSLVGIESLSRTCDYCREVIDFDGTDGNGTGADSRRDEYRLGRLLLESLKENSEQCTIELLRLNSIYENPLAFSVGELQFDIWHIDELVDWMKNRKPNTPDQVRAAIEQIRHFARLANHDPKRISQELKRYLRTDHDNFCILTQWHYWFQKYNKGSQLAADLGSMIGRLDLIAGGRQTDPQKIRDDLNFWASQLERPLLKFVDPLDLEELQKFKQIIDRTFDQTGGNPLRVFFILLLSERDWFNTALRVDKSNNAIRKIEGWVWSLWNHLRPSIGHSRIELAYHKAIAEANANNCANVLIQKMELVWTLHQQLIDAIRESNEQSTLDEKHNVALSEFQQFVEGVAPLHPEKSDFGKKDRTKRKADEPGSHLKWKSFLLDHHRYGRDLNQTPTTPTEVQKAGVCSTSTATRHFKSHWNGHSQYVRICADEKRLAIELKLLAGDMSLAGIGNLLSDLRDPRAKNPADSIDEPD